MFLFLNIFFLYLIYKWLFYWYIFLKLNSNYWQLGKSAIENCALKLILIGQLYSQIFTIDSMNTYLTKLFWGAFSYTQFARNILSDVTDFSWQKNILHFYSYFSDGALEKVWKYFNILNHIERPWIMRILFLCQLFPRQILPIWNYIIDHMFVGIRISPIVSSKIWFNCHNPYFQCLQS